eukprot:UC4_evm2s870
MLGLGFAGAALTVDQILFNVDGGRRAVVFDQLRGGIQQKVYGEGSHFIVPVIMTPHIFDIRARPWRFNVETGSKDLQTISLTLRVLYRPETDALPWIYKNYGKNYDDKVLPNIGSEILKATVAQYDAEELITQREAVSLQIREALQERAKDFHILFDDISLTHLTFGSEFTAAVEQKQVAQQDAERARYIVEQAEQEKKASIIRAEGDSEAADMISKSIEEHGKGLIELRKIEAAKEIAGNMARSRNVAYLPGGNNMLLNMA